MRRLSAMLLACLLSACAREGAPAPVANLGVRMHHEAGPHVVAVKTAPVQTAFLAPPARPAPAARKTIFVNVPRSAQLQTQVQPKVQAQAQATPPAGAAHGLPPALSRYASSIGSTRFLWPVRGRVVSGFGPKDGGLYNDGINIAAPKGTPVKAAADGTVAYVGNGLGSYGNLVLIRHAGGVMTAYAHMSAVRVTQGMTVRKGEAIGAVGATGAVASSQLHFEIRSRGSAVDPSRYLG